MPRILALHAHPDDIETLAAGTLALLAAAGHEVAIVTATAGECGSTEFTPEQTGQIRQGEAAEAAAMIGASYGCVGLPDLGVFNDAPSRRRVTEAVRAARPDIVITAASADYHPDHETISQLVRDACFASSAPNYRTGQAPALAAMPHLYFTDPIGGRDRMGQPVPPDFAVDITTTFETKRAMLACHRSQTEWLAKQHAVTDPLAAMTALGRKRGREHGVAQAEGFRQYRHEPYPTSPLLQELLGAAVLRAGA